MMPGGGRCAACKYLRRRCPSDCIFSHYFPANDPQRFVCVHKIYGASNVAKMLQVLLNQIFQICAYTFCFCFYICIWPFSFQQLPANLRAEAADSLSFEARHRVEDPVYGCVGIIHRLHEQIHNAETQLARTQAQLSVFISTRID